ncbi:hypothetical protein ABPG74_016716 [Tetrahymena malaccensis]
MQILQQQLNLTQKIIEKYILLFFVKEEEDLAYFQYLVKGWLLFVFALIFNFQQTFLVFFKFIRLISKESVRLNKKCLKNSVKRMECKIRQFMWKQLVIRHYKQQHQTSMHDDQFTNFLFIISKLFLNEIQKSNLVYITTD